MTKKAILPVSHVVDVHKISLLKVNPHSFVRMWYTFHDVVFHGLHLEVRPFHPVTRLEDTGGYYTYQCILDVDVADAEWIQSLCQLEQDLLQKHNAWHKHPQRTLYDALHADTPLPIVSNTTTTTTHTRLVLQIAGMWQTKHEYGLSFKWSAM